MSLIKIEVTTNCTAQVHSVLCNGLDNNAFNYWGRISWGLTYEPPVIIEDLHWMSAADRLFYKNHPKVTRLSIAPFVGGWISIKDIEDPNRVVLTLNIEALQYGTELMAKKYPRHFADMMSEDDDIETADALIQLSLFGDLVYG